jgi:hypothetical protein
MRCGTQRCNHLVMTHAEESEHVIEQGIHGKITKYLVYLSSVKDCICLKMYFNDTGKFQSS